MFEQVWRNIVVQQGERFETRRNIPFTYRIEGNNIRPLHEDGSEINRLIPQNDFLTVFETPNFRELPLTAFNNTIQGSSYVMAILSDPRILDN